MQSLWSSLEQLDQQLVPTVLSVNMQFMNNCSERNMDYIKYLMDRKWIEMKFCIPKCVDSGICGSSLSNPSSQETTPEYCLKGKYSFDG